MNSSEELSLKEIRDALDAIVIPLVKSMQIDQAINELEAVITDINEMLYDR